MRLVVKAFNVRWLVEKQQGQAPARPLFVRYQAGVFSAMSKKLRAAPWRPNPDDHWQWRVPSISTTGITTVVAAVMKASRASYASSSGEVALFDFKTSFGGNFHDSRCG
jgi:hypothetical protein